MGSCATWYDRVRTQETPTKETELQSNCKKILGKSRLGDTTKQTGCNLPKCQSQEVVERLGNSSKAKEIEKHTTKCNRWSCKDPFAIKILLRQLGKLE